MQIVHGCVGPVGVPLQGSHIGGADCSHPAYRRTKGQVTFVNRQGTSCLVGCGHSRQFCQYCGPFYTVFLVRV